MMPDVDEKCQLMPPIVVLVPFTSPDRDKPPKGEFCHPTGTPPIASVLGVGCTIQKPLASLSNE